MDVTNGIAMLKRTKNQITRFMRDVDGALLAEYGLLVSLIAAICIIVVMTLGTTTQSWFLAINAAL